MHDLICLSYRQSGPACRLLQVLRLSGLQLLWLKRQVCEEAEKPGQRSGVSSHWRRQLQYLCFVLPQTKHALLLLGSPPQSPRIIIMLLCERQLRMSWSLLQNVALYQWELAGECICIYIYIYIYFFFFEVFFVCFASSTWLDACMLCRT